MTTPHDTAAQWIRATHAPRCCSDCARAAQIFREPRTLQSALAIALDKKLGARDVMQKRFADMCASGLLVPYRYDD
jgi:hypothetical protein